MSAKENTPQVPNRDDGHVPFEIILERKRREGLAEADEEITRLRAEVEKLRRVRDAAEEQRLQDEEGSRAACLEAARKLYAALDAAKEG